MKALNDSVVEFERLLEMTEVSDDGIWTGRYVRPERQRLGIPADSVTQMEPEPEESVQPRLFE